MPKSRNHYVMTASILHKVSISSNVHSFDREQCITMTSTVCCSLKSTVVSIVFLDREVPLTVTDARYVHIPLQLVRP